jgi:hypothetical protein
MLAHRSVLYPRPGLEKKCVDCHRNLVHNARPYYAYKQYEDPYRAEGYEQPGRRPNPKGGV